MSDRVEEVKSRVCAALRLDDAQDATSAKRIADKYGIDPYIVKARMDVARRAQKVKLAIQQIRGKL